MTLSERQYQDAALPTLEALITALDEHPDELFADLSGDVLTIEFSGPGRYVVNSHAAARQIWLAAERSAWHFDYEPESRCWVDGKNGTELWATLESVLGKKLGRPVALQRPEN